MHCNTTDLKFELFSTPVEIEYQLEGSRITQIPGVMKFQEKWLYDILKSKAAFNELVRFWIIISQYYRFI